MRLPTGNGRRASGSRRKRSSPLCSKSASCSHDGKPPHTQKFRQFQLLASAGMTWDVVNAEALAFRLSDVERIDCKIMRYEGRRDASLRAIERHRMNFGQTLRRAVKQIEDAGYRVIEQKPDDEKHAA